MKDFLALVGKEFKIGSRSGYGIAVSINANHALKQVECIYLDGNWSYEVLFELGDCGNFIEIGYYEDKIK